MPVFLGIDTSNYTTSAALYDSENGGIRQVKRLLPVKEGQIGLRQSDAVFSHVKALGGIVEELFAGSHQKISAVGCSVSPRDEAGSYMPCFLVGEMAAGCVAAAMDAPLYSFSHQAGHIAAAVYDSGRTEYFERPFLAFHISGGTTQCLRVEPDEEKIFSISTVSGTLDLNAGQAVDRVGAMLGLPFPAGPALERLAMESGNQYKPRAAFKGMDCCLSGLENLCARMISSGEGSCDVARFCLDYIGEAIFQMTKLALEAYPSYPLLYAGGVMSNGIIRARLEGGFECSFASPAFSSDNAAGTAVLCSMKYAG